MQNSPNIGERSSKCVGATKLFSFSLQKWIFLPGYLTPHPQKCDFGVGFQKLTELESSPTVADGVVCCVTWMRRPSGVTSRNIPTLSSWIKTGQSTQLDPDYQNDALHRAAGASRAQVQIFNKRLGNSGMCLTKVWVFPSV